MHLNSDIYSEAIALKLRNRDNRLLTVLKKALFRIKLPRLFDLYSIDKYTYLLNKKDLLLLENIKSWFGVGSLYSSGSKYYYRVESFKDLQLIINHFDQYPLRTQKKADYLLFKSAYEIIEGKEHLTLEGLHKLLSVKAAMNKGLSETLKDAFPNITPVERPGVLVGVPIKIQDPN